MKINRLNVLTMAVAFMVAAFLLSAGPKPSFFHLQLSSFLVKLSFVFVGVWYCIEKE